MARARGSKNPTLEGCDYDQWSRSPLSVNGRHRCPRSTKITDHQFEGRPGCEPSKPANVKVEGNQLPPRNSPTDQGFET
jgi:hypothetical protein